MFSYFCKKLVILLLSLFVVATLTFFLMHSIPGDPFAQEKAIPQEILEAMQRHYGLDKPLVVQYFDYMQGLCKFDLGPSFKYQGRTVNDIITEGFPVSLYLGLEALSIALFLGVLFGTISAWKQNSWQDRTTMTFAILGLSIPSFLLATFLQYAFSMKLDLFPVARWGSFSQSVLPALSLAALPTAFIARLLRASMIEVLHQDYIQTAKAKGLPPFRILSKHVLRNAFLPIISYLGPLTASILTGSFAVEKIFGIPGLGQWFVLSITNRDYTVIMGTALFYSFLLMIAVFMVDLISCWMDPRIKIPLTRVKS
jgi:oligopeptide transport system permease protein